VLLADGVLAEYGSTRAVFASPSNEQVADYLSGRFG
jgi:ABC-type phosphate transport system ATPase subunit